MAAPMDDWRSLNKRKIFIQKLEERIKALGNPPTNLQNPIEVEKAFFDKSKSEEEYMNYFHNVILMLTRQKQEALSSRPSNMGRQQMNMDQPTVVYQHNQFGGVALPPSQVPNPNYPPGGGMGMGRPRLPPQYVGGPPSHVLLNPSNPNYPPGGGMGMGRPRLPPQYVGGPPSQVPNFNYPPGGGMGMSRPQLPPQYMGRPSSQVPNIGPTPQYPQYHPAMYPPGGNPNTVPQQSRYSVIKGMANQVGVSALTQPTSMSQGGIPQEPYLYNQPGQGRATSQEEAIPQEIPMRKRSWSMPVAPQLSGQVDMTTFPMTQIPLVSEPPAPPLSPQTQQFFFMPATPSPATPSPTSNNFPLSASTSFPQTSFSTTSFSLPTQSIGTVSEHSSQSSLQGPVVTPEITPEITLEETKTVMTPEETKTVMTPEETKTVMTPEENEMYVHKLGELQKYTPHISKWMSKLSKDGRNRDQFLKLKSLHHLLQDSNRRVPLQTLMKCGVVLEKMFDSQTKKGTNSSKASIKNPTSLPSASSSFASSPPPADVSDELAQEDVKKLFREAMEKGYVTSQDVVIILVGIAGSGKSSFKRVVLDLPPEETRVSTALAEAAIRNMSISRAIVGDSESVKWEMVTSEYLLEMVADAIKEVGVPQMSTEMPSTSAASLSSNSSKSKIHSDDEFESRNQRAADNQGSSSCSDSSTAEHHDEDLEFKDDPLLPLISKSKGSQRLLGVHWVYIIDTGGQPQFLQLLPAFIKNISSCVCLLRLDQNLDDKPLVKYFDKSGKQCGDSYPSEHTNLQVVESCVRTIHSRCCLDSDESPNCFVVGTHLDEYEKKAHLGLETIEQKNERLLKTLTNVLLEQSLTFYRSGDDIEKLIFPLNCKNPEERDRNVAAEFRKCVMSRCCEQERKIPLAWFVLEERIRQYAIKRKVAYVKKSICFKIASQLNMSHPTFQAALNHLLKLNIFRCYSCLPNLIFCDTQVVLVKLTELVQHSFQLKRAIIYGISGEDVSFKNEGIMSIKFLNRFSSFYSNLFTPESFLMILRELLAVADMHGGKFFMPCLLKELNEKEVCKHRSSSNLLSTLLIRLDEGCLPNGLFTSLIASLKNSHGWELGYGGSRRKPICLYQNCVLFKIPGNLPGTITLIASFKYLEVHVNCSIEPKIDGICAKVFADIRSGLEASWNILYPGKISLKLAFFCDGCPPPENPSQIQKHYADISECGEYEMCSFHPSQGTALCESKLRWLRNANFCDVPIDVQTTAASHCSVGAIEAGCAVTQQLDVSNSEFQAHLSFLPVAVFPYLDKILDWDNDFERDLIEIAKRLLKWEEVLVAPFGLSRVDVHDIKEEYNQRPELQRREVLHKWQSKLGIHATYKQLLEIFVTTQHKEGAKAVCEVLKNRGKMIYYYCG